jgi:hypothetical protein
MNSPVIELQSPVHAVEVRNHTHRGQAITLYRIVDSLHGSFWGWCAGDKRHAATYRHSNVAYDVARAYVDDCQR